MTYREHTAWVVKAYLQKHPEGNIMSVRYRGSHTPGAACPHSQLIFAFKSCPWCSSSWEGKAPEFDICFSNELLLLQEKRDVELSLEGCWCGWGVNKVLTAQGV